ncbi:isochorismate synthase [Bernardetia litoralis DSM 6794]|uniref:Isochorismate synthase n=1 Tax=Bernardetia litoralis (strain ATCC 23117 / DSM 6794 / NBRC 15988 / NCIMB 1366 / Fx l1 / Sio-4) TaxID=880071 RepID=I4AFK3_BERLS|nr:chorismate-binding protein [Bernardetia litoralis]AFM02738.1 isochorismate synthase [Bernardetia litoralis DSM 6794]
MKNHLAISELLDFTKKNTFTFFDKNKGINKLNSFQFIKKMWSAAIAQNLGVSLWREPNTDNLQLVIDLSQKTKLVESDLEELPTGFLMHKFEKEFDIDSKNNNSKAYFLEAHLYFDSSNDFIVENIPSKDKTQNKQEFEELNQTKKQFFQKLKELQNKKEGKTSYFYPKNIPTATTKEAYNKAVDKAIKAMQNEEFLKVVISRNKFIDLDKKSFDALEAYQKLEQTYKTAFVSLVSIPLVGTWMCATPELLVSQDKNGIFRTMALAGTQSGKDVKELKNALWRQKEIEEQALVSRYIINNCFKKIRLREYEEIGPKTVRAGNLLHLRTEFLVDTKQERFPQLATVMLELLHPTSAVCGMPKEITTQFILENENYDRGFYAGYLGGINFKNGSSLYVQLRCMQLLENQAILYAGGGITADSDTETEWKETEMKCQTIESVVFE